jgi:glycosyltransferase involved in cell wall biosynthesis
MDPSAQMSAAPLVSVIMNCYNGEKYLAQAIESVLGQSYTNWEIVFWDNRSTDRSADIFKAYADPRLKYFHAPTHTLLYEARNYALTEGSGELLAFLDVDDWWFPDKLEKQVPLFADPQVGIVCSNYWIAHEVKNKRWLALKRPAPTGWVLDELLRSYFVGLVTLMVRRSAVASLDYPFDPRYHVLGDTDLVIRLSNRWKLDSAHEPLAVYRIHDNNETAKHLLRRIDEYKSWLADLQQVDVFRSSAGFQSNRNFATYLEAMYRILHSDRAAALRLARALPWGRFKLRLYVASLLPTSLARRIKN